MPTVGGDKRLQHLRVRTRGVVARERADAGVVQLRNHRPILPYLSHR
ncbi:hypothetical protein ACFPRL_24790 [Pseudoclavibacter helvolus]